MFNSAMFTNKVKVYQRENIDIKQIKKTNTIFSEPSVHTKKKYLYPKKDGKTEFNLDKMK